MAEQALPLVLRQRLAEEADFICGNDLDKAMSALGWSTEMQAGGEDSLEKDSGPRFLATAGNSLIIWVTDTIQVIPNPDTCFQGTIIEPDSITFA